MSLLLLSPTREGGLCVSHEYCVFTYTVFIYMKLCAECDISCVGSKQSQLNGIDLFKKACFLSDCLENH